MGRERGNDQSWWLLLAAITVAAVGVALIWAWGPDWPGVEADGQSEDDDLRIAAWKAYFWIPYAIVASLVGMMLVAWLRVASGLAIVIGLALGVFLSLFFTTMLLAVVWAQLLWDGSLSAEDPPSNTVLALGVLLTWGAGVITARDTSATVQSIVQGLLAGLLIGSVAALAFAGKPVSGTIG